MMPQSLLKSAHGLGVPLSMPVVASPLAGMFNFGEAVTEASYAKSVLEGCKDAGIIGSTGDGAPHAIIEAALESLQAVGGHGIPFIKPWEGKELDEKLDRALASSCPAVGMDIYAAGLVTLRKMGRPVGPKPLSEHTRIVKKIHAAGIKFILKGIMTVSDALLAVESGADCIVASNHGGRVLASSPGTARVLPAIAEAAGSKMSVMVDGGVRNGADGPKRLALGEDIVGRGRPGAIAALGGGGGGDCEAHR